MEILVHLNKRIRSRPDVQLPLDQLLADFNESDQAFVKVRLKFACKISLKKLNTCVSSLVIKIAFVIIVTLMIDFKITLS